MKESIPSNVKGPFLRPKQAAAYLNISESTLYYLVQQGVIPSPYKPGPRLSLFSQHALDIAITKIDGE